MQVAYLRSVTVVVVIQTALFTRDYNYGVAYVLKAFPLSIVYIY